MKRSGSFIVYFSKFLAFLIRGALRSRYRVTMKGTEKIALNSPVLYLPNHPALIDPIILLSQIYRFSTATPVISEKYYNIPMVRWYFKRLGAVSVSDLEAGSRDTRVLQSITRSVYKGFRRNSNILIYPGGQLSGQGYEKILNKKSACRIVQTLPDDVRVVGVRITGLWGSMWSKARTGKSPDFFILLMKGAFFVLANLLFIVPKRTVSIEFEDITAPVRDKALSGLQSFNSFLEDYYNVHGEEPALFLKHYFFLP
jgi:1-acyl-sn-glycerol-3-phosphate acyltransferase